jgi:hypothetical protein
MTAAQLSPPSKQAAGRLTLEDGASATRVGGPRFEVVFDKTTGLISSFTFGGRAVLRTGPSPNFWRAPVDNDYGNGHQLRTAAWWEASASRRLRRFSARFADERSSVQSPFGRSDSYKTLGGGTADIRTTNAPVAPGSVVVEAEWDLPPVASSVRFEYIVGIDGTVVVGSRFTPGDQPVPELPRFGTTMELPGGVDAAVWYGRGPQENYIDRQTGAAVGLYRSAIADLPFPYERPQETGTRTDTRWVALTNRGSGIGLMVVGLPTFEFSAYPYALGDFDGGAKKTQRHSIDLTRRDFVTLNIDEAQMGLGGDNSWGALPHREYRIPPVTLRYSFILRPFGPGDPAPGELASTVRSAIFPDSARPGLDLATFDWPNRVNHLASGKPITVSLPQTMPWSRSGDAGLVDGILGSVDYRGGEWRMVEGGDFEATIDLGSPKPVTSVELAFLLRPVSALLTPARVGILLSSDGERYQEATALAPPPMNGIASMRVPVRIPLPRNTAPARFLRVVARSPGTCPPGLECAGSRARLAVDEIIVR